MFYSLLADLVLALHLGFILFVIGGGLVALRHPRLICLHLPAFAWGVAVELAGWYCPLTDLENHWRALSGAGGYDSSFIDRYLTPLIYPDGLTRTAQVVLGLTVLVVNLGIYGWMLRTRRGDGKKLRD